ncbi:MAG: fumarate hydratase C-terminal domain-containing protein [Syntrophales bacterium]
MESLSIRTPISPEIAGNLTVGDAFELHGKILCARDAALSRLVRMLETGALGELAEHLKGAVIFHTAVSDAGIGPTSSNKVEIESSIGPLSAVGVRIHLGKGAISPATVARMSSAGSVFAVTPPATALFMDKIVSRRVLAFPEEGMEALFELDVRGLPGIVAAAKGASIY